MNAIEFDSSLGQNGEIALPAELKHSIPTGERLRIVIMWEPRGGDSEWRLPALRGLASAYCPEDEIYEQLVDDSPAGL